MGTISAEDTHALRWLANWFVQNATYPDGHEQGRVAKGISFTQCQVAPSINGAISTVLQEACQTVGRSQDVTGHASRRQVSRLPF